MRCLVKSKSELSSKRKYWQERLYIIQRNHIDREGMFDMLDPMEIENIKGLEND